MCLLHSLQLVTPVSFIPNLGLVSCSSFWAAFDDEAICKMHTTSTMIVEPKLSWRLSLGLAEAFSMVRGSGTVQVSWISDP